MRRSTSARVHPRACGGTLSIALIAAAAAGASPRVRGNPDRAGPGGPRRGCIPARAGEPCRGTTSRSTARVHPRACGGTVLAPRPPAPPGGASPRVRGNPEMLGRGLQDARCIPARAGEPPSAGGRSQARRVHPRACGGTRGSRPSSSQARGASPRVRGNPVPDEPPGHVEGCIPARAGEPATGSPCPTSPRVHPRACGGTVRHVVGRLDTTGASPRVRGNLRLERPRLDRQGCIPARAGEPCADCARRDRRGVHPRACGGTSFRHPSTSPSNGASPRVRGNPQPLRLPDAPQRCIPARAGEPPQVTPDGCSTRVHPRACGGTDLRLTSLPMANGASPRVRGNRGGGRSRRARRRCIPARAGEPIGTSNGCTIPWVHPRACGGTESG